MILAIEARARSEDELVATVGRITVRPGAINVIPGVVRVSRSTSARRSTSFRRAVALSDIERTMQPIAAARGGAGHAR